MKDGCLFRAYPTLQQIAILLRWIGCQRFIYNSKVGENRYFRAFAGKFLSNTGLFAPIDQQYRQFKSELTPWLDEVPSQVLRNGAYKWAQAYQRYFKGLGGRPVLKRRHGKQSVWLTKELFDFIEFTNPTTQRKELKLRIGTAKYPVGILEFTAHRDFKIPASIHLSVHGGRWSISFNADTERVEPDEAQTLAALKMLSAEELAPLTLGLDRGVTVPLVGSDRQKWDISAASILYQNFQALKAAIPSVDALDFDDENSYDQSSTVQFAVMLGNLGYHVALDAYTNASYWTSVASAVNTQLPGTVDSVHLQAYAGGAGNSPCSGWNFGAVPVFPGLWDQDDTPSQVQSAMSGWHTECGITGGFMWLYDDFVGNGLAAQYASAINNALSGGGAVGIYNQSDGIVSDGTTFSGGLDGVGSAYSANLLGSTMSWNGVNFTFGPANGADVVTGAGQTITLTATQASSLNLLATAVNGAQPSQAFIVNYNDGTSATFTQSLSDWFVPGQYSGESIAKSMAYRDTSSGSKDNRTFNLYGYTFATDKSKTVQSITLPNNTHLKVLAIAPLP
jgi:hypothetical protein